jgi:aminomethyltransferase
MKLPVPDRTFSFLTSNFEGAELIIARTGYTGEDGVEIFCPTGKTESIWNLALRIGGGFGLIPCGLGARDSLRLEACLPLHGHELGEDISAIESGLSWIVKADKGEFTGRAALQAHLESSPRSLIGFTLTDLGIARHGDAVFCSATGERVGVVTSGTKTPTVNKALGLALVRSAYAALGGKLSFEVRGRKLAGEVVTTPFYKRAR